MDHMHRICQRVRARLDGTAPQFGPWGGVASDADIEALRERNARRRDAAIAALGSKYVGLPQSRSEPEIPAFLRNQGQA